MPEALQAIVIIAVVHKHAKVIQKLQYMLDMGLGLMLDNVQVVVIAPPCKTPALALIVHVAR
jgi:hypothetical protein